MTNHCVAKIIEVDKGKIYEYEANYSRFLELKAEREESKLTEERKIQAFLRKEYEWIKRGARARATKEKKRVEKYEELTSREKVVQKNLVIESAKSRLGNKTIELIDVSKSYDKPLFKNFSINVERDARVGFIGKNGHILFVLCAQIVGLYFLKGWLYFAQTLILTHISTRTVQSIQQKVFAHLLSLDIKFFNNNCCWVCFPAPSVPSIEMMIPFIKFSPNTSLANLKRNVKLKPRKFKFC